MIFLVGKIYDIIRACMILLEYIRCYHKLKLSMKVQPIIQTTIPHPKHGLRHTFLNIFQEVFDTWMAHMMECLDVMFVKLVNDLHVFGLGGVSILLFHRNALRFNGRQVTHRVYPHSYFFVGELS